MDSVLFLKLYLLFIALLGSVIVVLKTYILICQFKLYRLKKRLEK